MGTVITTVAEQAARPAGVDDRPLITGIGRDAVGRPLDRRLRHLVARDVMKSMIRHDIAPPAAMAEWHTSELRKLAKVNTEKLPTLHLMEAIEVTPEPSERALSDGPRSRI